MNKRGKKIYVNVRKEVNKSFWEIRVFKIYIFLQLSFLINFRNSLFDKSLRKWNNLKYEVTIGLIIK